MGDIFRALASGTRFKKDTVDPVFENGSRGVSNVSAPVASLDFFGVAETEKKTEKKSKEKGKGKGKNKGKAARDEATNNTTNGADESSDDDNSYFDGDSGSGSGSESEGSGSETNTTTTTLSKSKRARKKDHEANVLRKALQLTVDGSEIPHPLSSFDDLYERYKPHGFLQKNIEKAGYVHPTPIQCQAIPCLLEGKEVLGIAPTGSGKTAAFLIPIIIGLGEPQAGSPRAVVVAPTRELALQIHRECVNLTKGRRFKAAVLTKATSAGIQTSTHVDIVVTTPMRLVHMIEAKNIDLTRLKYLVMDEADRLFELGFVDQVDAIVHACDHPGVVRMLCSATMPPQVEELARSVMPFPIRITVGTRNAAAAAVEQKLVFVGKEEGKILAIRQLIQEGVQPPVLVFVQSKQRARELFHELVYDGINVDAIHSDRTQAQRDRIVANFRSGKLWVLICTDLMARGVDFKGVNCVINFDFPQTVVSYIHRIGRTGRAGRKGRAITLFTEDDADFLRSIANVMVLSGCEVSEWMLKLKKIRKSDRRRLANRPPRRQSVKDTPLYDRRGSAVAPKKRTQSKKRKEVIKARKRKEREAREKANGGGESGGDSGSESDEPKAKRQRRK